MMERRRSVFITTDAVGGVWKYSTALANGMAEEGWACTLAVLGPPPTGAQIAELADGADCTILATGLALEWSLSDRKALDRLIASVTELAVLRSCQSVHLHAPALAANGWPVPVVAVAHSCMATWWHAVRGGTRPDGIAWHADATAQGLRLADDVVAPSRAFAASVTQAYDLTRRIAVIHNGLSAIPIDGTTREKTVLAAGRVWDEGKNIGMLDRAAGMMRTPMHLAGACSAPDAQDVVWRHLRCLGVLPAVELRAAMRKAAIFASPACYEPFGLAVLEAAQLATPLVLSDIPTFRELWSGAAIFLPTDDARAWADCLDALVEDEAARSELGRAARERADRYTASGMVSATTAIHRDIARRAMRAA